MTHIRNWSTAVRAQWAACWVRVSTPAPRPEAESPQRGELIAQWHELQTQSAVETEARNQKITDLESSIQEALARARRLGIELEGLCHERMAQSFRVGAEQDRLRAALEACCPAAVETFLRAISAEIWHWQQMQDSDARISRRLQALLQAREQASTLRRAPLVAAAVLHAIHRIENSLPPVDPDLMRGHPAAIVQGGNYGTR